jgi:hypothetical protein
MMKRYLLPVLTALGALTAACSMIVGLGFLVGLVTDTANAGGVDRVVYPAEQTHIFMPYKDKSPGDYIMSYRITYKGVPIVCFTTKNTYHVYVNGPDCHAEAEILAFKR